MSSRFTQPWWQPPSTQHDFSTAQLSQSELARIGVTSHTIEPQLNDWLEQYHHVDAYNAFATITNQHTSPIHDIPEVQHINDTPSITPDVFTDGAFNFPRTPRLALSNAGIWWPGRTGELDDNEVAFTHYQRRTEGIEAYAALHGASTSSARPELLALILAMLAPRAMHVAIDNLS
eukprot:4392719-Karenia_brevis.AAC.1